MSEPPEQLEAPPIEAEGDDREPVDQLRDALKAEDPARLEELVWEMPADEMLRGISRLDTDEQERVLEALPAESAAHLVEELPHMEAAEILDGLDPQVAARIVVEMHSDEQADVLQELDDDEAEAILEQMTPQEQEDVRLLSQYPEHTAGGIMITEYLSFFEGMRADDVLADLRTNAEEYAEYDVQYAYVIASDGVLKGVLRLRDLVLARRGKPVHEMMIESPRCVKVTDTIEQLEDFFERHYFYAVPVVDEGGRLLGIARRAAVEEALAERDQRSLQRFAGMIAGEENRGMPVFSRGLRRLAFLTPNILLNLIAASVVAMFVGTIEALPYLAIFLPILSDMSGCSGNQAVAVSMRELALGLVKPDEVVRTLGKEVSVGLMNGFVLGVLLAGVAFVYSFVNPDVTSGVMLGVVVGVALMANSVLAVAIGGTVPLLLKLIKVDPAMAAGPILTTITDLCGFFLALGLATWLLLPN